METKEMTQVENKTCLVQLVDGEFTTSEASDIVTALIKEKINYHKIEGIQNWERRHEYDQLPLKNRIEELENELKRVKSLFSELNHSGKRIRIDGVLKISEVE